MDLSLRYHLSFLPFSFSFPSVSSTFISILAVRMRKNNVHLQDGRSSVCFSANGMNDDIVGELTGQNLLTSCVS